MMKLLSISSLFLVNCSLVRSWTFVPITAIRDISSTRLSESNDGDPCWQDIYGDDDDCGMSTVYSANFVAEQWIKSMPCAAGIEDCDMHDDLKLPNTHTDAGIDHVDVMSFLNLKRAIPLQSSDREKNP
eukprot:CAMPEP_0197826154 /NCGR_PEP_ID=MMETSP1437-20131217/3146_1 /TAXON_ID=49252 ORGANISM="Eucampia antarctica, Strain CCMP1452" /NCGR_SAMPLE_ID=MMETSP1437 /ASSEMBLY_ACC=CAM_ASM_001096 /LENGTH=128 /DNA_ID=CAMNT_0043426465 /DNA_START=56 /DNA_END=442 /DNA_ORIENTATION=-